MLGTDCHLLKCDGETVHRGARVLPGRRPLRQAGVSRGRQATSTYDTSLHAYHGAAYRRSIRSMWAARGSNITARPFVTVREAYTSSFCPRCGGTVDNDRGVRGLLRCNCCGVRWSRDVLGAKNILAKGMHLWT